MSPVWNGVTGTPTPDYCAAMIEIEQATSIHIEAVGRLFDLYRRFYECDPDLDLATSYIRERIEQGESFIHVATIDGEAIGFVQSYPTFCSVGAIKRHVLYDLYVDESHRDAGVGARLMDAARDAAIADGAKRVDLETAHDNAPVSTSTRSSATSGSRVLHLFTEL